MPQHISSINSVSARPTFLHNIKKGYSWFLVWRASCHCQSRLTSPIFCIREKLMFTFVDNNSFASIRVWLASNVVPINVDYNCKKNTLDISACVITIMKTNRNHSGNVWLFCAEDNSPGSFHRNIVKQISYLTALIIIALIVALRLLVWWLWLR